MASVKKFSQSGRAENGARTKKKSKERGGVEKKGTVPFFPLPRPLPRPFLLSPHSPRVLNAKTPSSGPMFRSACTGTLATQAKQRRIRGFCVLVESVRFMNPKFVLNLIHPS